MFQRWFLVSYLCLSGCLVLAQDRCGTVEYEAMLSKKNKKKETSKQFEQWMKAQLDRVKNAPLSTQRTEATYTIPVVVHVIHTGEPIGTGVNISDAQILSQIPVLNNDFNRLNADQVNTPSVFQPVAGSFDVQFVLAKQDPNGIATSGIVRVQGAKASWVFNDDFQLKSQSYWPAEQYLNIWVTNLTDFLGYTQFPVSTLPGLQDSSNERLTDGIVVNYRAFGSNDAGAFDLKPQYNKGRTLTHEMGHFFGLRHTWGDGTDCTSTDYVADTPTQSAATRNCPSQPQIDCSTPKMFQNYLDYSDDVCMNIFTQGQVARMNTVIQNSPRRKELTTSSGSLPPSSLANDLGIKTILNPASTTCSGSFTPSIVIRNYGINPISSAQIQLKQNNAVVESKNLSVSLAPIAEQQIDFLSISLAPSTSTQFEFLITSTNSTTDGNSSNNSKIIFTTTPTNSSLPIQENFASFPTAWSLANQDNLTTWQTTSTSGKTSIYLNFYNYTQVGSIDRLITPLINLTTVSSASLIFDRAYSTYPGNVGERLRILASTACRFDVATTSLFDKSDDALATVSSRLCEYVPGNRDWATEVISLNSFVGQSIQLAFEGTNANGNNLYISNVRILTGSITDLKLVKLESPSPVSCTSTAPTQLRVKNNGTTTINSLTTSIAINGAPAQSQTLSGLGLVSNEERVITLSRMALVEGNNQVTISLINPNGITDANPQDNSASYQLIVNNSSDIIPLREKFDGSSIRKWSNVSQLQQPNWTLVKTNYSQSLVYTGFTNTSIGDEAWVVSPTFDLTSNAKASLFFDVSYAQKKTGCDFLRLLASSDCGVTFTDVLFNQNGSQFSVTNSDNSWLPSLSSDWITNYINLDTYVGKSNIRFAFVATNGNGNNLYLDNLDFYEDDSPSQQKIDTPFAVYGGKGIPIKITFNLDERQSVNLQIFNSIGQVIADTTLPETINQTYSVDVGDRGAGIYIVRLQIGNQSSSRKVYVGN